MGGLRRHPFEHLDRAEVTRMLRFPRGRTSLSLGEADAGQYELIATCLSCWRERRFPDTTVLAARWGNDASIDDVARRMRCRCGARNCVLGVRPAPPPPPLPR